MREATPDTPRSSGTHSRPSLGQQGKLPGWSEAQSGLERSAVRAGSAGLVPPTRVAPWDNSSRSAVPGSFPDTSRSGQVWIIQRTRVCWLMAVTGGNGQDLGHRSLFPGAFFRVKTQTARTSVDMGSHSTAVPVQHSAHPGPLSSGMTNIVSEICILKP